MCEREFRCFEEKVEEAKCLAVTGNWTLAAHKPIVSPSKHVLFIAECLSTRLINVLHTSLHLYVRMYIHHTLISMGSLVACLYRHDMHVVSWHWRMQALHEWSLMEPEQSPSDHARMRKLKQRATALQEVLTSCIFIYLYLRWCMYCSLPKKSPWAEHPLSLPKWGVGTLSTISAFNCERAPTSCLQRLKALEANNWTQNNVQRNHQRLRRRVLTAHNTLNGSM